MAKNLRAKIANSDSMVIHDVNPAVTKKLAEEVGNVTIAQNVREVAEKTVCEDTSLFS
jgi:3-hydroxyisobutyrate/3-hydroxypropionate dehydrogenase